MPPFLYYINLNSFFDVQDGDWIKFEKEIQLDALKEDLSNDVIFQLLLKLFGHPL
jgi:hypothetical protein